MFGYQYQYEVASLFFLTIMIVRYFSTRRFPNRTNTVFGVMLVTAFACVSLDMVSVSTTIVPYLFPTWVIYVVNIAFFCSLALLPALMLFYIAYSAGLDPLHEIEFKILLVLALLIVCIVLTDPIHGWVFYLTGSGNSTIFHTGPLFGACYAACMLYLPTSIVLTIKCRSRLGHRQFWFMVLFIFIIMAAVAFQMVRTDSFIAGMAMAGAALVMYFNIQDPNDMLDPISGVFNYSAMIDFINDRIHRKDHLAFIGIDLSGFRRINTVYGIEEGNNVLHQIGSFLKGLDERCWVFRMIGTRFLILAPIDDTADAVAHSVGERFEGVWGTKGRNVSIKASIRRFDDRGFCRNAGDAVNLVDMAFLERSLEDGSHTWEIDNRILESVNRRLTIEDALRSALDRESAQHENGGGNRQDGFKIFLQPVFQPGRGCCLDAEALLRFSDPVLGSVSPAEFIPIAEKSGLIPRVDRMVYEKTCRFIKENHCLLERYGFGRISVNLSALEDYSEAEVWISRALEECGVLPEKLMIEITETAATTDGSALGEFMKSMNKKGYRFALDDFGTGYANLSQILTMPFSTIKLDRELLISEGTRMRDLFCGFLAMFDSVGLSTVVEGVETEDQAKLAIDGGASRIQGFYYARPMSESDFLSFLTDQAERLSRSGECVARS